MSEIIKLAALKYGETDINEKMAYPGGDESVKVPISLIVYLIETKERKILVDAGCDTMPGYKLRHFCSPVEILRRATLSPEEITDVILTHAHHDHSEATHHFLNATVHVEEGEIGLAKRYIPQGMLRVPKDSF